jgi:hypothetical protein
LGGNPRLSPLPRYFVLSLGSNLVLSSNMKPAEIVPLLRKGNVSELYFFCLFLSGNYYFIFTHPYYFRLFLSWLYGFQSDKLTSSKFDQKIKIFCQMIKNRSEVAFKQFYSENKHRLTFPLSKTQSAFLIPLWKEDFYVRQVCEDLKEAPFSLFEADSPDAPRDELWSPRESNLYNFGNPLE